MYEEAQLRRLTQYFGFQAARSGGGKSLCHDENRAEGRSEWKRSAGWIPGPSKLRDGVPINEQSRLNDPEVKQVDFHEWKIPACTNTTFSNNTDFQASDPKATDSKPSLPIQW